MRRKSAFRTGRERRAPEKVRAGTMIVTGVLSGAFADRKVHRFCAAATLCDPQRQR